jgi:hypothetical protein
LRRIKQLCKPYLASRCMQPCDAAAPMPALRGCTCRLERPSQPRPAAAQQPKPQNIQNLLL